MLILILLVLTGSYAGLWALRFVLEQRTDAESGITTSRRIQSHLAEELKRFPHARWIASDQSDA